MKLFLCKKNKRCPAQTKRPLKRRKHKLKKKTNTRKTYFPLQSIGKWKRQSGFAPKMIWKIDWFHREHKRTTNKESIKKSRKETLKNLPDWRKRKRNKKNHPAFRKNKRKEGKRLLINNIYFFILIYQNKKSKGNRTWTVKGNTKKGPMRDGTLTVARSQSRACNQTIAPHSTGRHHTPTQGCSRDTAEQGIDGKTPDHINHSCLNTRQIQNNTEYSQKKRLHESPQTGKGSRRHRQKSKSYTWQHRPSSSDFPKQKRKLRKKETEGTGSTVENQPAKNWQTKRNTKISTW